MGETRTSEVFGYQECNMNSKTKRGKRVQVAEVQGKYKVGKKWFVDCPLCNKPVEMWKANLDHIIPLSKGGHPTDVRNLQLTHPKCNSDKGGQMREGINGVKTRPGMYACTLFPLQQDNNICDTACDSLLS
jgi:hypothetical protein